MNHPPPPIESRIFLSHVMKLMYVATKTRPDILFAVSYLASRSVHPTLHDLNGTRNYGLKVDVEDMTLQQDNKSHSRYGWSSSNKTRHIRSKYHFIVEKMGEGVGVTPSPIFSTMK
jgi:hypothetical protein